MSNDPYMTAVSTMAAYTIYRNRNDMSSRQYMQYVDDWKNFQRIWIQDYYLSNTDSQKKYTFSTYTEYQSFLRGQSAHIDVYDSNSPGRTLGTISVPTNLFAPANQFTYLR